MAAARTAAATAGIHLLKRGSEATLHEKGRPPYRCTFTLSEDESVLTWQSSRGRLLGATERLRLGDVVEVLPCDPTFASRLSIRSPVIPLAEFQSTLTFLLLRALPTPPSDAVLAPAAQRETVDLSFDDEETFGHWVAALRALQAVWPEGRPVRITSTTNAPRPGTRPLVGVHVVSLLRGR